MGNSASFLDDGSAIEQSGHTCCCGARKGVRPEKDYTDQHETQCCFTENYNTATLVTSANAVAKAFLSPPKFSNPGEVELWLNFGVNVGRKSAWANAMFGFPEYLPQMASFISRDEYQQMIDEITEVVERHYIRKNCCLDQVTRTPWCLLPPYLTLVAWPCFIGTCMGVTEAQTKIYTDIRASIASHCPRGRLAIVGLPSQSLDTPSETATDMSGNKLYYQQRRKYGLGPIQYIWPPEGNNLVLTFTGDDATQLRASWPQQPGGIVPTAAAIAQPVVAATSMDMTRYDGGPTPKFCAKCGTSLSPGDKFCNNCGSSQQ